MFIDISIKDIWMSFMWKTLVKQAVVTCTLWPLEESPWRNGDILACITPKWI